MDHADRPFKLTLELRPKYLFANIRSDTIDLATAVTYLNEITECAHKHERVRVLLERDIPATLDESKIYLSGTDFAHSGLGEIRLAVVDRRPENAKSLELAILVQNNRGANIKLFSSIDEAESWLLKPLPHLAYPL